jgi:hypothetical protein
LEKGGRAAVCETELEDALHLGGGECYKYIYKEYLNTVPGPAGAFKRTRSWTRSRTGRVLESLNVGQH